MTAPTTAVDEPAGNGAAGPRGASLLADAAVRSPVDAGFFVAGHDWTVGEIDEAAAALLGRPRESLLGRTLWDACPELTATPFAERCRAALRDARSVAFAATMPTSGARIDVHAVPTSVGLTVSLAVPAPPAGEPRPLLETVVERVPAAVYAKDLDGRYVFVNAAVEEQFGRARAEIIGRTDHDLMPAPIADAYVLNDRRSLEIDAPFETTTTTNTGGGRVSYRSVKFPLRDGAGTVIGIGGISTDVSAWLRTESALQASEARFQQLAENIDNAVFWITELPDNRVRYVSPSYERLWGLSAARLYESQDAWVETIHPEDRDRTRRAFVDQAESGDVDIEYRIVLPDGRIRWVRDRGYPLPPNDDGVTRVTGFAEDVTDRKEREERAARIQALSAALSGAADAEAVAAAILEHGVSALGATAGLVVAQSGEPDEDSNLVVLGRLGYPADAFEVGAAVPMADAAALLDAIRQGAPVVVRSREERLAGIRARETSVRPAAGAAGVALPLVVQARPIGAIELSYPTARSFDAADREAFATLAGLAAQALDRARLFDAADDAQLRYRSLFDGAADAILVADLDGHLQDVNPAVLRLLGYGRDDLLRRRIADVMAGDDATSDVEFQRFLREGVWQGEHLVRRADGAIVPVESNARIVQTTAGPVQWISLRDISSRRELERLQQGFLSSVSHDLKNPLSVIKGQAQFLQRQLRRQEPPNRERLGKGLATIEETVGRTTDLIQELIDVARLRSGQELELHRQPVDLVALARTAADQYRPTSERHVVTVETDEAALTGPFDARRLERVIGNLLTNAIKFSPAGGEVTIRLDREETAAGGVAVLAVHDRGVGIPPADASRIFDRFQRGTNVGGIAGSGIGLAGVRQIVEQHGGTIAVEGREGGGSVFAVRLPLGFAAQSSPPPAASS